MKRVLEGDSRKNGPLGSFRWLVGAFFRSSGTTDAAATPVRNESFDAAYYLESNPDVAEAGVDPFEHYINHGRAEGRPATAEAAVSLAAPPLAHREPFDIEFYLEVNPDVASAGMDPYEHYLTYGKQEGRVGVRPELKWLGDFGRLDPARQTVLVVSHEASRTGAPILSLNIARELKKKYNVVSMLLRAGTIEADFQAVSDIVVEPAPGLNGAAVTASLVDQLLSRQSIDFAIVNSIESRGVLPVLARYLVPAITLIHEFAAYTRPRDAFRDVALWSADMVFSAPVIRQDALTTYPDIAHCVSHILPQGRCSPSVLPLIDERDHSEEDARIARALRPPEAAENTIVVMGAGTVQLRKGVDLFLECAARVVRSAPSRPVRFVWVGKGYDPERDMDYSVYLSDQLKRAGLKDHFEFVGETSSIDAAYAAADLLLVSSRLDPLPNVAIDAMAHGMPVICFDQTTGIADVLKSNNLGSECVATYLDAADMASKVMHFVESDELRRDVGRQLRQVVAEQFCMAHYVAELEALAEAAQARARQERLSIEAIEASTLPDLEFMTHPLCKGMARKEVIRSYVRSWASGIRLRKPCPGLHPGIYGERAPHPPGSGDPFAHYLQAGQPEGPWKYPLITPADSAEVSLQGEVRVALHLHVYYPDLLPDIIQRLSINRTRPDLYVSVPSNEEAEEVQALLDSYDGRVVAVTVVPNRGRDIGPFLTAFGKTLLRNYDFVGHLHTKKTKDVADTTMAETWRGFMLAHLLGDGLPMADIILARMIADPEIGMVCPDDPYVVDWGQNRPFAQALAARLSIEQLPEHFLFPVGTMFWARTEALRPCFELDLQWTDYPAEPLPYDGSVLHALERLFGLCAAKAPYRLAATHVPGSVR